VRLAAKRFDEAGFDTFVDGHPFTPTPSTTAPVDPFVALFGLLPPALRPSVYEALARVLHPDHGGDSALMQQLNRAKTANEQV
jgi:hypothetical protein